MSHADRRINVHSQSFIDTHTVLQHNDEESFKKLLDPEDDLDQHQNLMDCSVGRTLPHQNISPKSIHYFLTDALNKPTNKRP